MQNCRLALENWAVNVLNHAFTRPIATGLSLVTIMGVRLTYYFLRICRELSKTVIRR